MDTPLVLKWKTSSFTGSNGDCVEAAWADRAVFVRDTKARDGGTLDFPASSWQGLLTSINQ